MTSEMTTSEIFMLAGMIVALGTHLVILTSKLSTFMAESKKDISHIRGSVDSVLQACKECFVKKEVERMDVLQQELRRTLPLELQALRSEITSLKKEITGLRNEIEGLKKHLNGDK